MKRTIALLVFVLAIAFCSHHTRAGYPARIYKVKLPPTNDISAPLTPANQYYGDTRSIPGDVKGFACDKDACYVVTQ
jgi:hypothetical protein